MGQVAVILRGTDPGGDDATDGGDTSGSVEAVTRVASAMTIPMAMVCPMIATLNPQ